VRYYCLDYSRLVIIVDCGTLSFIAGFNVQNHFEHFR
jgi:hypothetical protein